jgi:tRNA-uridine 2-sulfurtransferase
MLELMTSMFKTNENTSLDRKSSRGKLNKTKKVFVGLSGGVDSAVSAALLKRAGYDVTGVFIKVWHPEFLTCNWREERRDAMKVSLALDIPFLFMDFEEEYKRGVADYMIAEYKAGRTPNPDILCNREIKFKAFWKQAKELGADFIATGHYAQVHPLNSQKNKFRLKEGLDKDKDQSYFLWTLTQEDLRHVLFPIGNLKKTEVRNLARKFGLPVSDKKDSQGLCFLGEVSLEEFLSHFVAVQPGVVLNSSGDKIGTHKGSLYYTIGERHGFEVVKKDSIGGAYYVVSKDMTKNTITVSNNLKEIISFSPRIVILKDVNWLEEPRDSQITARVRYRGQKLAGTLMAEDKKLAVVFEEPERGLSVGQSIVFYQNDILLGGGVMDEMNN